MADSNESVEVARKRLEQDKELVERSRQEYAERMKGKPTPTQEENDLAVCGAHIVEHEDDGSGPDPFIMPQQHPFQQGRPQQRHLEGQRSPGGDYQTRQSQASQGQQRSVTPTPQQSRRSE